MSRYADLDTLAYYAYLYGGLNASEIARFPTADVEPVRHGRWLPNKITASSKCSECGRVFADETPCCPNCGTRMDGGEKE